MNGKIRIEYFAAICCSSDVLAGKLQRVNMRRANQLDIPAMHRVRLAVRENALSDPNRITERDYCAALDEVGRTWVVEVDQEVIAFATGYRDGSIWALFVHPDHEGRGHARALHSAVTSWLWSLGHERISLSTTPGTRAERFYVAPGMAGVRRCNERGGSAGVASALIVVKRYPRRGWGVTRA